MTVFLFEDQPGKVRRIKNQIEQLGHEVRWVNQTGIISPNLPEKQIAYSFNNRFQEGLTNLQNQGMFNDSVAMVDLALSKQDDDIVAEMIEGGHQFIAYTAAQIIRFLYENSDCNRVWVISGIQDIAQDNAWKRTLGDVENEEWFHRLGFISTDGTSTGNRYLPALKKALEQLDDYER